MSLQQYIKYPYADIHRGLIGTLSAITAIFIGMHWHFDMSAIVWFVIIASLSCFALCGSNKPQQLFSLAFMASIIVITMLITSLLLMYLPLWLFWIIMIGLFWGVLLIPKLVASFLAGSIMTVIYQVMLISKGAHVESIASLLMHQSLPILAGFAVIVVWVFLLPTSAIAIPIVDQSAYYVKRVFRLSIAIPIAFFVGYMLHLQHASWICFTVIVVSQANFGATIRKSLHRLAGTILGVMLGVPLTIYIFGVYPWSHWIMLAIFFICLVSAVRFYYIAIFLATLLIASIYYIATPAHIGPVMYILYRLLDTFTGVVLVVLLELFIFPNSVEYQVRKTHRQYWGDLYQYLSSMQHSNKEELQENKKALKDRLACLSSLMNDMKFEPIGQLTLRFRKADALFKTYHRLAKALLDHQLWTDVGDQKEVVLNQLLPILKQLNDLPYSDHARLAPIINKIKQEQLLLMKKLTNKASLKELTIVNQCLLRVIKEIEEISDTPRWAFL